MKYERKLGKISTSYEKYNEPKPQKVQTGLKCGLIENHAFMWGSSGS